jgi:methyl-accepting chemotaxis protein
MIQGQYMKKEDKRESRASLSGRRFTIFQRILGLLGCTGLLTLGFIAVFIYGMNHIGEYGTGETSRAMLEGQKEKIKVATHAMAESLGQSVQGITHGPTQVERIRKLLDPIRFEEDGSGYFFVYRGTVNVALPTKKELQGKDLGQAKDKNGVYFVRELSERASEGGGFTRFIFNKPGKGDQPKLGYSEMIPGTDMWVGTGVYIDNIEAARAEISAHFQSVSDRLITWSLAILGGLFFLGVLPLSILVTRTISRPINRIVEFAKAIQAGDLSTRLHITGREEIGTMAQALDQAADSLEAKAGLAEAIAEGDLSGQVTLASDKDTLGRALQTMTANLNSILSQVNDASAQVAVGAGQVSDSSQSLSQGATEQASSLEEISSSMNQIGSQTKTNAENASQANLIAEEARKAAETGSGEMKNMVRAMDEISSSSNAIARIIKVIDEIAFQTNLLALNAAVEAARAGQHGKGFAVVAEEVRNLAGRSAKAARETSEIIETSVATIENGENIAQRTAKALEAIVTNVARSADLVGEIAAASNEQAQGVSQVNQGLSQVDQVVQQTTANAEETAAASEELSSQASEVRRLLSRFRLQGAAGTPGSPTPGTFQEKRPAVTAGRQAPARRENALGAPAAPRDEWGGGHMTGMDTARPEEVIALDDDEFGKY